MDSPCDANRMERLDIGHPNHARPYHTGTISQERRTVLDASAKSHRVLSLIAGDHHRFEWDAEEIKRSFQDNGNLCTRIRSHDNELGGATITEAAELARSPARAIRKLRTSDTPAETKDTER